MREYTGITYLNNVTHLSKWTCCSIDKQGCLAKPQLIELARQTFEVIHVPVEIQDADILLTLKSGKFRCV